jgi:hypothetical protein
MLWWLLSLVRVGVFGGLFLQLALSLQVILREMDFFSKKSSVR